MNVKWSPEAIDGLNLDWNRPNQMELDFRLCDPYELPLAPEQPKVVSE